MMSEIKEGELLHFRQEMFAPHAAAAVWSFSGRLCHCDSSPLLVNKTAECSIKFTFVRKHQPT